MVIFNALQTSLSGGIGRYSYELSKSLYLIMPKGEFKIVIREEDCEEFNFAASEDLVIVKNIKSGKMRNLYEQFQLPKYINQKWPEAIVHYPDSMAPIFSKNKVIITIHDLAFKSLKNVFTFKTKVWKNIITKGSVKKANKIIAITKFTRMEIDKHYGEKISQKTNIILNGFNNFSNEQINLLEVRDSIKVLAESNYILTVSTISPRKNIDRLIKAFTKINDNEMKLVISGAYGWMYDEVLEIANNSKCRDKIIFTNKINDEELKFLYRNTKFFVYPSLYEGFGLPPLEAMSYGKAVTVSNRSSLPEVVEDNAVLFNPEDEIQIIESLNKLLNTKVRKDYELRALDQVKKFSWEKCANEVLEVYKNMN